MKVLAKDGILLKYPYSITDLIRDNRNISWPAVVSDECALSHGCYEVVDVDKPQYDHVTQVCNLATPVNVGGEWLQSWEVIDKTQEQIDQESSDAAAAERERLKAERAVNVASITVTTAAGNTFDGDEVSQGRMARAIVALQATGAASTLWVLADNTVINATAAELIEAMVLAGQAQAAVWVLPT